jgi:hypothetical protein
MNNTDLSAEDLKTVNRCVPVWARALNTVYDAICTPVNKALNYFEVRSTRNFIAAFDKKNLTA